MKDVPEEGSAKHRRAKSVVRPSTGIAMRVRLAGIAAKAAEAVADQRCVLTNETQTGA
jgi:hypothetical protein